MQPEPKRETEAPANDIDAAQPQIVRRRRIAAVLFLMMISFLLSSTLLVIGGVLVFRNAEAKFWRHTQGVLLDAHIDTHPGAKDPLPDVPAVKYTYSVNGKAYVSDKWS